MAHQEHTASELLGNDRDQRTRAFMVESFRHGQDERLARRPLLIDARAGDERAMSKLELDHAADSRRARALSRELVDTLGRNEPITAHTFGSLRDMMQLAGKWQEADRSIARHVEEVEHATQHYIGAMTGTGALIPLTPHQIDELSFDAVDARSTRDWDDISLAKEALHEQRLDERAAALDARRDSEALWLETVKDIRYPSGTQNDRVDPLAVEWRAPSPIRSSYPTDVRATLDASVRRTALHAPRVHKVRPTSTTEPGQDR